MEYHSKLQWDIFEFYKSILNFSLKSKCIKIVINFRKEMNDGGRICFALKYAMKL